MPRVSDSGGKLDKIKCYGLREMCRVWLAGVAFSIPIKSLRVVTTEGPNECMQVDEPVGNTLGFSPVMKSFIYDNSHIIGYSAYGSYVSRTSIYERRILKAKNAYELPVISYTFYEKNVGTMRKTHKGRMNVRIFFNMQAVYSHIF